MPGAFLFWWKPGLNTEAQLLAAKYNLAVCSLKCAVCSVYSVVFSVKYVVCISIYVVFSVQL